MTANNTVDELDQESEQALLLEEAYQLGYHKVRNGCLQEPLRKLNALIAQAKREAREKDPYGNPIIWLSRYEAERVSECLKKLRANKVQGYDTGDWFLDVPHKIDKWLATLTAEETK